MQSGKKYILKQKISQKLEIEKIVTKIKLKCSKNLQILYKKISSIEKQKLIYLGFRLINFGNKSIESDKVSKIKHKNSNILNLFNQQKNQKNKYKYQKKLERKEVTKNKFKNIKGNVKCNYNNGLNNKPKLFSITKI